MHHRTTTPGEQLFGLGGVPEPFRQQCAEFANDVAQMVNLLLACRVAFGAAAKLDIFLTTNHGVN